MPDRPSPPRTALVLGGGSDIAIAVLRRLAADGLSTAVLATRDSSRLSEHLERQPLPLDVTVVEWDALAVASHAPLMADAAAVLGTIDLVLCAVGSLGHGAGISAPPAAVEALVSSNFTGPATAVTAAAQHLLRQGGGTLVVLSSVAGLRARRSNYLYGSAKAGLDTFTQGLCDAVEADGVRVHLVRPGFVTSKMTTGLEPAPFATTPEVVAEAIAAAVSRPRGGIVHVPRLLGPLFGALRATPRPLWRRIAGDR